MGLDPISWAAIGLMAAGTAMEAMGSHQEGKAQEATQNFNARVTERNAVQDRWDAQSGENVEAFRRAEMMRSFTEQVRGVRRQGRYHQGKETVEATRQGVDVSALSFRDSLRAEAFAEETTLITQSRQLQTEGSFSRARQRGHAADARMAVPIGAMVAGSQRHAGRHAKQASRVSAVASGLQGLGSMASFAHQAKT